MKNRSHFLGRANGRISSQYRTVNPPIVEMYGDRRVLIEWHYGVISYDMQEVLVKTGIGLICVTGERLMLCRMCREQLAITGLINSVVIKRSL